MFVFTPQIVISPTLFLLLMVISPSKAALKVDYYQQTCPNVESIISETVRQKSASDPKVPARILRMFFHDCFIRGCDASLLVDSTPKNKAEKDGPPNKSLGAFYVIEAAKAKLESACPRTVSCADIIAIAARDVVVMTGGPNWDVLKGRKDGRVSKASDTSKLPPASGNVTELMKMFSKRGLKAKDLVALSGGHTLGFSHCSSFEARIRNFSPRCDIDPTMNQDFAQKLRNQCPKPNKDRDAGEFLDPTPKSFDNAYYKSVVAGKGVFGSDQALYFDNSTRGIVESFAKDQRLFFREFVNAMLNLGNVWVLKKGDVREKCGVVN